MRTDLTIIANPPRPSLLPKWPKANSVNVDTDFNTKILRVTDSNTYQGKPIFTADSGQSNLWNTNSTMFVVKIEGGKHMMFGFDPAAFQAHSIGLTAAGDVCFSRTQRNRLYVLAGTEIFACDYRSDGGFARQTVCDFAKLLPKNFAANWNGVFCCSADDSTFTVAFSDGRQDSAVFCASFKRGYGLRLWNTLTGEVTGGYGQRGKINLPPFAMHEAYQTPNPAYVVVVPSSGTGPGTGYGPYFWHIETLMAIRSNLSGHAAHGMFTYRTGGPGGGQFAEIKYASPQDKRVIIPAQYLPKGLDVGQHSSLNNFTPPPAEYELGGTHEAGLTADIHPFLVTWVNKGTVSAAWEGEIVSVNPVTGRVWRLCHHCAYEGSPYFDVANAIVIQSQDGRFGLYCSDFFKTIAGDCFVLPLVAPFNDKAEREDDTSSDAAVSEAHEAEAHI